MPAVPMMDFVSFLLWRFKKNVSIYIYMYVCICIDIKGGRHSRLCSVDGAQAEIVGAGFTCLEGFFNRTGCYAYDFVWAEQLSGLFVCCISMFVSRCHFCSFTSNCIISSPWLYQPDKTKQADLSIGNNKDMIYPLEKNK